MRKMNGYHGTTLMVSISTNLTTANNIKNQSLSHFRSHDWNFQRKVFLSAQPKAMVAKKRTRDAQVFYQNNPVNLFITLLQIPFTEVLDDVEWSTWGQLKYLRYNFFSIEELQCSTCSKVHIILWYRGCSNQIEYDFTDLNLKISGVSPFSGLSHEVTNCISYMSKSQEQVLFLLTQPPKIAHQHPQR